MKSIDFREDKKYFLRMNPLCYICLVFRICLLINAYLSAEERDQGVLSLILLTMAESIQGNNSFDSARIPLKQKRGHPQKDESLYHVPSVRPRTPNNLLGTGNASVPEHVNPVEDTFSKVGQAVTAVVEAEFDDGYVITGKIGNSDLRGVLFKPGHYAPVTAENDVAPHLSMIRGKETPHATQKRSDARQRRPKESHQRRANYLGNGSLHILWLLIC